MKDFQVKKHLKGMILRMPNREDNPFKWNRWLGFMQGVVWMLGKRSIDELKQANKESLNAGLRDINDVLQTLPD